MKKVFEQIRKHWLTNLITFLISLTIGVAIFLVMFLTRNRTIIAAIDGVTVGGLVILAMGLLCWLSFLGAFDLLTFGFKQLGNTLFSKDPRKAGHFEEFQDEKRQKRLSSSYNFIAMMAAGLLILIAIPILEIIYKTQF